MRRFSRAAGLELVVSRGRAEEAPGWARVARTASPPARPSERCAACLGLRLDAAGAAARDLGFARFSTTLTVSPYQRHDLIARGGRGRGRRARRRLRLPGRPRPLPRQLRREPPPRALPPAVLRLRRQQVGGLARAPRAARRRTRRERRDRRGLAPRPTSTTSCPTELIAQTPAEPRDASRLLVARARDAARSRTASSPSCPSLLRAGDVLVRNDTRVFPARSFFHRATGGRIEVLFLLRADRRRRRRSERWEALLRGRPRRGGGARERGPGAGVAAALHRAAGRRPLGGREPRAGEPVLRAAGRRRRDAAAAVHHDAAGRPRALPDDVRPRARLGRGAHRRPALHAGARRGAAPPPASTVGERDAARRPRAPSSRCRRSRSRPARCTASRSRWTAAVWARLCAARRGRPPHRRRRHDVAARAGAPARSPDGAGRTAPTACSRRAPACSSAPGFEFRMVDGLRDQLPPAAHEPAGAGDGLLRRRGDAAPSTATPWRERYRFYSFGDAMLAL